MPRPAPLPGGGLPGRSALRSKRMLSVSEGSLSLALYPFPGQRLIESEYGHSDQHRKAKFHRLTAAGRVTR